MKTTKEIECEFDGVYEKDCPYFKDKKVGSINCIGMKEHNLKPCEYYISHTNKMVFFNIIKENVPITKKVMCSYNKESQLKLKI